MYTKSPSRRVSVELELFVSYPEHYFLASFCIIHDLARLVCIDPVSKAKYQKILDDIISFCFDLFAFYGFVSSLLNFAKFI